MHILILELIDAKILHLRLLPRGGRFSAMAVIVDRDCDIGTSLIVILFPGLGEYLVCPFILHVVLDSCAVRIKHR